MTDVKNRNVVRLRPLVQAQISLQRILQLEATAENGKSGTGQNNSACNSTQRLGTYMG